MFKWFWTIFSLGAPVTETDISAYHDSEITRPPVTILLTPEDQSAPRGPWFGKCNNSLLENEEFVTKLKFLIQNSKEKYKELNYWYKALLGNDKNGD